MPAETTPAPRSRWRRGGRVAAIIAVVVLLGLVVSIGWISRPARLSALILDRVGTSLGLQITATGASEYRLRGTPMLTVRGLDVRQPGSASALLTAERAYLALPWATLWAGGEDLTIRRVELDGPQLDLRALQDWLATRPEGGPLRIPTLTEGLGITRGRVAGEGWSVDRLGVSTDHVSATQPLIARLAGRLLVSTTTAAFDVQLALTRPVIGAGAAIAGITTVHSGESRIPLALNLSGALRDDAEGIGLDATRLGAHARWFSAPSAAAPTVALALGMAGRLRYRDGGLIVAPLAAAIRGRDNIPEQVDATGSIVFGDALVLHLSGEVTEWPVQWPELPAPLGASNSPFPFTVDYAGPSDLSDPVHLQLSRDETRFDGRFQLPELIDWVTQLADGTPLPPLTGSLTTPRMEVAGATLTGVQLEMDDGDSERDEGLGEPEPHHGSGPSR
ncbi:hypothetical protein [Novilysobacter antarcticus]|uniref:hypothetical protein n=1 Tax=Novilysobacter antarcticus TaxID=2862543 RepID=UPI001C99D41F|nr:hypothetical protein [Lysobacter antarcticus]